MNFGEAIFDRPNRTSAALFLVFILFLAALYFSGYFIDWEELTLEPFFILKGMNLYSDIATHHGPLLTDILVFIYRLLGLSALVRKLLLLAVSGGAALLTWRSARKLAGERAALFSLALLAVLWPFYGGTDFWFDTFLALFYLVAFWLLIGEDSSLRLFIAGGAMGLSFLVKASGGQVALVMLIMLLVKAGPWKKRTRNGFIYSAGVSLPVLIAILSYGLRGRIGDAYYWIVKYNLSGMYTRFALLPPSITEVVRLFLIIIPILVLMIASLSSASVRREISWPFRLAFYTGLSAALALLPRWERFHVAPALPFLVICVAMALKIFMAARRGTSGVRRSRVPGALLAAWIGLVVLDVGSYYPPLLAENVIPGISRLWPLHSYRPPGWYDESARRFQRDIPRIAEFVRGATADGERIFVWGWNGSRIYLEAGRLPSGKFYYTLPWFTGLPRFPGDLLRSLREGHPRFVIVLKNSYPGTPTLADLRIDLAALGYVRIPALEAEFPDVVFWRPRDNSPL